MYRGISYLLIFAFIAITAEISAGANSFTSVSQMPQNDSIKKYRLDSVTVRSAVKNKVTKESAFAVGTNVQRVDAGVITRMAGLSLSELVKDQSSVYIKEYGRGMASYISVRGTSSSHTNIAWNGINLAVPTLGQANLSQVPIYFFDKMELHVGGSAMLYGDGAIGGSIQLSTVPVWKKGFSGDLLLSGGSYSTLYGAGTLRYSNGRTESRSSLFATSAKNDYTFRNNTKPGHPKERLNNSGYSNHGILQEVHRKLKDSSVLSFSLWYLDHDREIQPSVAINDRPQHYASVRDRNIRGTLHYGASSKRVSYSLKASYANDFQQYEQDIIEASRFSALAELQYNFNGITFKGGATAEHTIPAARSFADSVRENRFYVYGVARYIPSSLPGLLFSAGIRAGSVTNGNVPLMPSAEARYTLLRSKGHNLAIRGAVSRNSRVPTLNDRYWGGVHTYLRSENSFTVEGGSDYHWFKGSRRATASITLYSSSVNDWIRWLPAGNVWRPQNVPKVHSKGAEALLSTEAPLGRFVGGLSVNYSYTSIKMVKGLREGDPSVGRQLAFQPRHSVRGSLSLSGGPFLWFATISFTGDRTTLDIFDVLDPYTLLDAGARYKGVLGGQKYSINLTVKNITGTNYQNVKFYAMPGRNYNVAFRLYF